MTISTLIEILQNHSEIAFRDFENAEVKIGSKPLESVRITNYYGSSDDDYKPVIEINFETY